MREDSHHGMVFVPILAVAFVGVVGTLLFAVIKKRANAAVLAQQMGRYDKKRPKERRIMGLQDAPRQIKQRRRPEPRTPTRPRMRQRPRMLDESTQYNEASPTRAAYGGAVPSTLDRALGVRHATLTSAVQGGPQLHPGAGSATNPAGVFRNPPLRRPSDRFVPGPDEYIEIRPTSAFWDESHALDANASGRTSVGLDGESRKQINLWNAPPIPDAPALQRGLTDSSFVSYIDAALVAKTEAATAYNSDPEFDPDDLQYAEREYDYTNQRGSRGGASASPLKSQGCSPVKFQHDDGKGPLPLAGLRATSGAFVQRSHSAPGEFSWPEPAHYRAIDEDASQAADDERDAAFNFATSNAQYGHNSPARSTGRFYESALESPERGGAFESTLSSQPRTVADSSTSPARQHVDTMTSPIRAFAEQIHPPPPPPQQPSGIQAAIRARAKFPNADHSRLNKVPTTLKAKLAMRRKMAGNASFQQAPFDATIYNAAIDAAAYAAMDASMAVYGASAGSTGDVMLNGSRPLSTFDGLGPSSPSMLFEGVESPMMNGVPMPRTIASQMGKGASAGLPPTPFHKTML